MKVSLEQNYRSIYTLDDLDRAKMVISAMREDIASTSYYARIAAGHVAKNCGEYLMRVVEANAYTAKNCNVWDAVCEGSEDMEVWFEIIAKTTEGFVEIGVYWSDINAITGDNDLRDRMYIIRYVSA